MKILSVNNMMALFSIAWLCSCAEKITRPESGHYKLNVTDNTKEHRFDVSLESFDNRALCISIESWPNSSGSFTVEKSDTFLQVGVDRLPAKSKLMSVYCPGGCGEYRVEANGSLEGFISYEVFGDPERLAAAHGKYLDFPVKPYYCR